MVCLSCTATGERVCLAAEGFGNRHCFLENIADKNVPPDLSQCVFVIEQVTYIFWLYLICILNRWEFGENCPEIPFWDIFGGTSWGKEGVNLWLEANSPTPVKYWQYRQQSFSGCQKALDKLIKCYWLRKK